MPIGQTHKCPGLCGRDVPNRYYACGPCWRRLPRNMRAQITVQFGRDAAAHAEAMLTASRWLEANQPTT